MEWEPNERDAWVADAQRWISQIKGVLQCKIDLDDQGDIAGVHVVAGMERDPRHIVRDVESLLKARLQMDVYYKKIGVVQVLDGEQSTPARDHGARGAMPTPAAAPAEKPRGVTFLPPRPVESAEPGVPLRPVVAAEPSRNDPATAPLPAILVAEDAFPRPVCRSVTLSSSDAGVRAEVRLSSGGREAVGVAESPNHQDSDIQCIARATVDAVAGLLALPLVLHLREVRFDTVGDQATVLAAVDLVESRRTETLLGACAARHNRQQAVVHAVLGALNRRLGLFALRDAAAG